MSNVKPITPKEVSKGKLDSFPDKVIEAFNELIAKHWDGRESHFKQDEVVALIRRKMDMSSSQIFENNWLDVEDTYRKAGWTVEYDSPAYCEDYPATFKFTKKRARN
jgi:hypothetical protein